MSTGAASAASARAVVKAVSVQNLEQLKGALRHHAGPVPAQAMVNAGRLAWTPGLKRLAEHGADLNASFRNYRALHALIQEKPHEDGSSTPKRVACLKWMLAHGADPELTGAWPAARALVIAAFQGERGYVDAIRESGARLDIFTAAALGDAKRVQQLLSADPGRATARDDGLLTALQCCGGSALGAKEPKTAAGLSACARLLVDAGADVNAWSPVLNELVRWGQFDRARAYLAKGPSPNLPDDRGWTAVHQVVSRGNLKMLRDLLAAGGDPNRADLDGRTPRGMAKKKGRADLLEAMDAASPRKWIDRSILK